MGAKPSKTPVGNAIANVSSNVQTSCNVNNVVAAEIKDVSLKIKNLTCTGDINLITQKMAVDNTCTTDVSHTHVAAALAAQLKKWAARDKTTKKITLFGSTFTSTDSDLHESVKSTIKASCGNGNTAVQIIDGVTVDVSGVACNDLNILTQHTSYESTCAIKVMQHAHTAYPNMAPSPPPPSDTVRNIGYISAGVVVLALIVGIIVHMVKKNNGVSSSPGTTVPASSVSAPIQPPVSAPGTS